MLVLLETSALEGKCVRAERGLVVVLAGLGRTCRGPLGQRARVGQVERGEAAVVSGREEQA